MSVKAIHNTTETIKNCFAKCHMSKEIIESDSNKSDEEFKNLLTNNKVTNDILSDTPIKEYVVSTQKHLSLALSINLTSLLGSKHSYKLLLNNTFGVRRVEIIIKMTMALKLLKRWVMKKNLQLRYPNVNLWLCLISYFIWLASVKLTVMPPRIHRM